MEAASVLPIYAAPDFVFVSVFVFVVLHTAPQELRIPLNGSRILVQLRQVIVPKIEKLLFGNRLAGLDSLYHEVQLASRMIDGLLDLICAGSHLRHQILAVFHGPKFGLRNADDLLIQPNQLLLTRCRCN